MYDPRSTDQPAGPAPDAAELAGLHPECPDWERLGPTPADARLRAQAAAVLTDEDTRTEQWGSKFSRRKVLAGGLGVGVAALGSQLVTARVSYAAGPSAPTGTLVVIFLRGGLDGLSVLVPASSPELRQARPDIAVGPGSLIPVGRGFGLHPALAPLKPLVASGRLAAVPAVSTPDLSRSHFQAQDCLERGGAASSRLQNGWLDRVVTATGPGTTFRSIGLGGAAPRALMGPSDPLTMMDLESVTVGGRAEARPQTMEALRALYTGLDHPIAGTALSALHAPAQAAQALAVRKVSKVKYPKGDFGRSLRSLAALIRAGSGVRVANLDVGGWDMHTSVGTAQHGQMHDHLRSLANNLAAFTQDLGPHLDSTTVVLMSEFGRRVRQNGNHGTDHGHGGVLLAMGGGVRGGVHGRWQGLAPSLLDDGDVPGLNDYRDVLSDVVMGRFGLSAAQAGAVFPGWKPTRVGMMA